MRYYHSALTEQENVSWNTVLEWKKDCLTSDGTAPAAPPAITEAFEVLNRAAGRIKGGLNGR